MQIAATLALATLFWWLIERPSTLLSKRFRSGGSAFGGDCGADRCRSLTVHTHCVIALALLSH